MSPIRSWGAVFLALVSLAPSHTAGAEDAGLSYAGSSTIGMAIFYEGALKGFEKKSGARFTKIDTLAGSTKGVEQLIAGKVSMAGVARELTPAERGKGLVATLIGYDAVGLWVNATNPVTGLSKEQAKAVFTGKVRNWKELGGGSGSIQVYVTPPESKKAVLTLLEDKILDNLPLGKGFTTFFDYSRDSLMAVAGHENSLCPASIGLASTLNAGIRKRLRLLALNGVIPERKTIANGTYLLSRPLYLVTRDSPSGLARDFIDFIRSPEGQEIVGRNFLPLS